MAPVSQQVYQLTLRLVSGKNNTSPNKRSKEGVRVRNLLRWVVTNDVLGEIPCTVLFLRNIV